MTKDSKKWGEDNLARTRASALARRARQRAAVGEPIADLIDALDVAARDATRSRPAFDAARQRLVEALTSAGFRPMDVDRDRYVRPDAVVVLHGPHDVTEIRVIPRTARPEWIDLDDPHADVLT